MKKVALSLPLLFVSSMAYAQTAPDPATAAPTYEPAPLVASATAPAADEPQTLTGSRGFLKHNGWYVAPTFGATTLDGHYSSLVGMKGAWLINRQFGIGLAGSAFGWGNASIDTPAPRTKVDGGYGGLLLQYVFASDKIVHGTIDATIGGGGLCFDPSGSRRNCDDNIVFYVFEPTANVEVNVTSFMRVAAGGGYRFATIDEDRSLPYKPSVGGFVARVGLEFGQF
ncbi:MAG: hypothetical protein ABW133_16810 [Polyangiaceae bacterium]